MAPDPRLQLAFEESARLIDHQREDFERFRTRAVGLISVASLAAGVLGAVGVNGSPTFSKGWLYTGVAAFAVLVIAVLPIVAPRTLIFENDPRVIIEYYVDGGVDMDNTLRWMAHYNAVNWDSNQKRMDRLVWAYLVAVAALGVTVIALTLALFA